MIVLDTNVVSEAMRPDADASVLRWLNAQAIETMYLSSVTLAELFLGVGVLPRGARRARLEARLDHLVTVFARRVLPFDSDAARRFADMAVHARSLGRPLPASDGYVAATAATRGYAVATRNTRHFADTGATLIDPWQNNA